MTKAKGSFESVVNKDDRDFLTMFSFICILSFDVYMRKHVIEQIIDNSLKPDKEQNDKEQSANGKEAKDNPK